MSIARTPEQKRRAREASARFRARNPGYERNKSIEFRRANPGYRHPGSLANLQYVNRLKSEPCTDCGQRFPTVCMDFDHLPGTEKSGNVGTMVAHGHSLEKIQAEIEKCELVCSNCHRIRTHERALIPTEVEIAL